MFHVEHYKIFLEIFLFLKLGVSMFDCPAKVFYIKDLLQNKKEAFRREV